MGFDSTESNDWTKCTACHTLGPGGADTVDSEEDDLWFKASIDVFRGDV